MFSSCISVCSYNSFANVCHFFWTCDPAKSKFQPRISHVLSGGLPSTGRTQGLGGAGSGETGTKSSKSEHFRIEASWNQLKPVETSWNQLKTVETSWNQLKPTVVGVISILGNLQVGDENCEAFNHRFGKPSSVNMWQFACCERCLLTCHCLRGQFELLSILKC